MTKTIEEMRIRVIKALEKIGADDHAPAILTILERELGIRDKELREAIINHPKTFGITDKQGRGGAILVEDVLSLLPTHDNE